MVRSTGICWQRRSPTVMRPVTCTKELIEAVNRAKTSASDYRTNLFADPQKIKEWIAHGDICYEPGIGSTLFFRSDRDFYHLYFCASTPADLQRVLCSSVVLAELPIVVDLIGQQVTV